jgi:methylglyoxal synthase
MKRIALVAHDNKNEELVEWAEYNKETMKGCQLYATGTTAKLLEKKLELKVHALQSGPLGGDQQIGAMITEGKVDILIFFWDPLQPLPHDPDIKALLRLAVLWNIPLGCTSISLSNDAVLYECRNIFGNPVPAGKIFILTLPDVDKDQRHHPR